MVVDPRFIKALVTMHCRSLVWSIWWCTRDFCCACGRVSDSVLCCVLCACVVCCVLCAMCCVLCAVCCVLCAVRCVLCAVCCACGRVSVVTQCQQWRRLPGQLVGKWSWGWGGVGSSRVELAGKDGAAGEKSGSSLAGKGGAACS